MKRCRRPRAVPRVLGRLAAPGGGGPSTASTRPPTPRDDLAGRREGAARGLPSGALELEARLGSSSPKIGLAGCGANLLFLAGGDMRAPGGAPRRAGWCRSSARSRSRASDNPRALWIVGGGQLASPPAARGHPDQAAATYHLGTGHARARRPSRTATRPPDPRVGRAREPDVPCVRLHEHVDEEPRRGSRLRGRGALRPSRTGTTCGTSCCRRCERSPDDSGHLARDLVEHLEHAVDVLLRCAGPRPSTARRSTGPAG